MHFADQWWWWSFQQQELLVIVSPSLIMLAEFQKESISFKASVTLKRFILSLFVILIEIRWTNHHFYIDPDKSEWDIDTYCCSALLSAVHCVNKCKNAWFYIQWSWPIFSIFIENYKNTPHGTMCWKILYSNLSFCPGRFYNAGAEKAY